VDLHSVRTFKKVHTRTLFAQILAQEFEICFHTPSEILGKCDYRNIVPNDRQQSNSNTEILVPRFSAGVRGEPPVAPLPPATAIPIV